MKKLLASLLFILFGIAYAQNTTVYFDSNKSELNSNTIRVLDSLTAPLKKEMIHEIKISVTGHCDNTGANDFNYTLSENRAKVELLPLSGEKS